MLKLSDARPSSPGAVPAAPPSNDTAAPVISAEASKPAPVVTPAAAPSGGGKSGMWIGAVIAVIGIAAAGAVYMKRQPAAPVRNDTVAEVKPTAAPAATEAPKAQATAEPAAVASNDPAPADAPKSDDVKNAGSGTAAAPASTAVASADVKSATPSKDAPKGSKVGTLDEEMQKAAGGDLPAAPQDDGSKPASGGGANLPEQPSQGNAQAAIRAVQGAARACVAGAPEPSSATITFGSSGSVTSVSVGGWAAANGKTACVKSALQGAHVSPFSKPSYSVPVNIRP